MADFSLKRVEQDSAKRLPKHSARRIAGSPGISKKLRRREQPCACAAGLVFHCSARFSTKFRTLPIMEKSSARKLGIVVTTIFDGSFLTDYFRHFEKFGQLDRVNFYVIGD